MHLTGEASPQVLPVISDPGGQRRVFPESAPREDLLSLGMRADRLRRELNPGGIVTYVNTLRVAYALTTDHASTLVATEAAIERGVERGATGAVLEWTHGEQTWTAAAVELLLRTLRRRYPTLWLEMLIPSSAITAPDLEASLGRMRTAGLDTIACDPMAETATMLIAHRAAHSVGMRTAIELRVLPQETPADRAAMLCAIGRLQDETGGFTAVRVTAPANLAAHLSDELTAVEYLTAVAMARLALPNIPHIESSWRAQGLKLLQMTLRFGANDAGSSCLEQAIARPGPDSPTEEDLRHVIRDAGLSPVERRPDYSASLLS